MSALRTGGDRAGYDWDARATNMLIVAELRDTLDCYKADDSSWPRGLVQLRDAIARAEAQS